MFLRSHFVVFFGIGTQILRNALNRADYVRLPDGQRAELEWKPAQTEQIIVACAWVGNIYVTMMQAHQSYSEPCRRRMEDLIHNPGRGQCRKVL